jgi:hypothetical protein
LHCNFHILQRFPCHLEKINFSTLKNSWVLEISLNFNLLSNSNFDCYMRLFFESSKFEVRLGFLSAVEPLSDRLADRRTASCLGSTLYTNHHHISSIISYPKLVEDVYCSYFWVFRCEFYGGLSHNGAAKPVTDALRKYSTCKWDVCIADIMHCILYELTS